MGNYMLVWVFLGLLGCDSTTNDSPPVEQNTIGGLSAAHQESLAQHSFCPISFDISLWYDDEGTYQESTEGWGNDYSIPDKFDILLTANNGITVPDDTLRYPIKDWFISVRMKFKIGDTARSSFPLNPRIVEDISLLNHYKITKDELLIAKPDSLGRQDYRVKIWVKDFDFRKYVSKYRKDRLFINQIFFYISSSDAEKINFCNYEYIFFMQDGEEF